LSTWRAAGVEAERDVGEPEDGRDARQLALDRTDALDGLDAVVAALLHAGRERQGEGVEEEVAGLEAVAVHGHVVDGARGPQLPLGRAGLALLVDAGAHDRRPVLAGEGQEGVEPGARGVALLQVHRVQDGPTAEPLEGGFGHGPFGCVDHEGADDWVANLLATSVMSPTPSAPV